MTSHEPLQTEPQGLGAPLSPSLCPSRSRHSSRCTHQPKYNNNNNNQKKSAAGNSSRGSSGRAVVKDNHHHGSYLPGHAQPPTDIFSHVWCESDQNDGGGGSVIPALFLSSSLSSFSPVTAAATEAAHMSVCYPHGSHTQTHTHTHTHRQGAEREKRE